MTTQSSDAQRSGKAIASLVLGILSLATFGIFAGRPSAGTLFCVVAGIAAISLGHVSRSQIKRSQDRLTGKGTALAGLILGYLGVVPSLLSIVIFLAPGG
jgi:hypothetical protein